MKVDVKQSRINLRVWLFTTGVLVSFVFSILLFLDVWNIFQLRLVVDFVGIYPESIGNQIIDSLLMLTLSFVIFGLILMPVLHK